MYQAQAAVGGRVEHPLVNGRYLERPNGRGGLAMIPQGAPQALQNFRCLCYGGSELGFRLCYISTTTANWV
jgi:hypothetical protein